MTKVDNMKEVMISEYADLSKKNTEALQGLKEAIKEINDNNILHRQALEKNTEAILNIRNYWGEIVRWLILALIVLAGAEKVIGLLK